ncbi:hypothetical protein ABZ820_17205 [Streptomyces diacarni]|uniref:hypothetical protein n=1 Tax=Streptomyces diacarni TaxID=2800381 RepID=UPI00340D58F7
MSLVWLDVAVVDAAGLFTGAVVAVAVGAVSACRSGLVSGAGNAARQTGTALGVAAFGTAAGSPCAAEAFTAGMRRLGLRGAAWGRVVLAVTTVAVPRRG